MRKNKFGITNKDEFIEKSKEIHGNKYDYSKVEYKGISKKVCLVCPKHGDFFVTPFDNIDKKCGCKKCSGRIASGDEFIEKFTSRFPEKKYTFESIEYKNNKIKIPVFCHEKDKNGKEHGVFYVRPNDLISGYGCPKCGGRERLTTEKFIERAREIHGERYDYSKVEYVDIFKKVCIICNELDENGKKHGEFWQVPNNHLNGAGCPRCNSGNKSKMEEKIGMMLDEKIGDVERQKTFDWLKYKRNLFFGFLYRKI